MPSFTRSGRTITPSPTRFVNITDSTLDKILGGSSASMNPFGGSSAPPGGDQFGTGTGSNSARLQQARPQRLPWRRAWTGLTGAATTGASSTGSGGCPLPSGGVSAGGLTMSVGKLSGGSGVGPPGLPGTVGGASKETFSKDDRRRFEFVVMLVWCEPVPKIEPNADTGTTGQQRPRVDRLVCLVGP